MNMTLKNMLDVSKNLIGSIQENLREFAGKNHDFHLPDDITLHRRPNSAGALAGHSSSGAGIGRSGEERFFEDDGDDQAFDPDNYAFTRRSPGGSASGSRNQGGDDLQTVAPSSPSRSAQLTALMQSHAQPSGSAAWPTKRTLLNSMESIICGDLFVVDYFWNPAKTSTELIAKNFVSK